MGKRSAGGIFTFRLAGYAADVDFGDLLDYLGRDTETRAILLYVESITSARKFMSAARATARAKPVIVPSARAAQSHSGALAGSDAVYDAAFLRAGILRVDTFRELFDAAEILSRWRSYAGPRLAIVTNGGGPAVLATDALIRHGGALAELSTDSVRKLEQAAAAGDARAERYLAALDVVLEDPGVDALLVMHAPIAVASVSDIAAACAPKLATGPRPALACWLGAGANARGGVVSETSAIPSYPTPEEAVGAFQHVVRHHESQALLLEAPAVTPGPGRSDIDGCAPWSPAPSARIEMSLEPQPAEAERRVAGAAQ